MEERSLPIDLPMDRLRACLRWRAAELALFGSVLREDFKSTSDIDVLVTFAPGARHGLFDLAEMQQELEGLMRHRVNLATRGAVERSRNPIRRKATLDSARVTYAAA